MFSEGVNCLNLLYAKDFKVCYDLKIMMGNVKLLGSLDS